MDYPVTEMIDGEPCFEKPLGEILAELEEGGELRTLTPLQYHTHRQRKWYKGICLPGLSDWSGETCEWWDREIKKRCHGAELLNRVTWLSEKGQPVSRLTIVEVGKKKMTAFIKNILSKAVELEWPITEPDPDLSEDKLPPAEMVE